MVGLLNLQKKKRVMAFISSKSSVASQFSYEALLQLGGDLGALRLSSPQPSGFKFNSQSSHAVWIQIKPPVSAPA